MKKIFIFSLMLTVMTSCRTYHEALFVILDSNRESVNPVENGLLALKADVESRHEIQLVLVNEADEEFRVSLNPEVNNRISFAVGPVVVAEKKFEKEQLDTESHLYELPPGTYKTVQITEQSGGANFSKKLIEESFTIEANKITYIGAFDLVSRMIWIFNTEFSLSKGDFSSPGTTLLIEEWGELEVVNSPLDLKRK